MVNSTAGGVVSEFSPSVLGVLVRNGGSFEDDLSLGAEGMFVEELYLYLILMEF